MDATTKSIQLDINNKTNRARRKEEEQRATERIQEMIRQNRKQLGLGEVNRIELSKSDSPQGRR